MTDYDKKKREELSDEIENADMDFLIGSPKILRDIILNPNTKIQTEYIDLEKCEDEDNI